MAEERAEARVLHGPLLLVSFPLVFMTFALPIFGKEAGATAIEIGGLFSVFNFVVLVVRPLVGLGLDRYGRKAFLIGAVPDRRFARRSRGPVVLVEQTQHELPRQ